MASRSLRQLSALRPPANQETAWRVRRQGAAHTQQASALHWAKDHSPSSSSTSPGSAATKVSASGGKLQAFFWCPVWVLTKPTRFGGQPQKCVPSRAGSNVHGKPSKSRTSFPHCSQCRGLACCSSRRHGNGTSACPPSFCRYGLFCHCRNACK